ncbi:hypothetical protein [Caldivirga sp. UBA161]|uniref:hypothetical protein n=1 Tax=Caldivirga sp. UBA161 TaxID=1915569 RepID=UPI0025C12007|nr:hypothetical protein [Caldivirga sp. UBA161]
MHRTTPTVILLIIAVAAVAVIYLIPTINAQQTPGLTFETAYFGWTWSPAAFSMPWLLGIPGYLTSAGYKV